VIAGPEVKTYLDSASIEAVASTPAEFDAYFRQERDRWARIIKETGAQID
ncbi:MAG: tripartite tricarboxylate transporter substrate binding protein, partial [Betaproteobacteria bacterium]|nr:tripartite tricarboxylate transporter substrate binding protein [Betaproteobacteria bacterium]